MTTKILTPQEKTERSKRLALKTFLTCMPLCASLVILIIWWPGGTPPQNIPRLAMSLFVVGLGSFLVWFTATIIEIKQKIAER